MTDAIWEAVDLLTKPTRVKVERVSDADWLAELADPLSDLQSCDVVSYRAATTRWATVPSLWVQSTQALSTGMDEGTGSKPLRERSPADLELLEIRSIIRDTTRLELEKRGTKTVIDTFGRQTQFDPSEIRSLASKILTESDLDWWEYRFAQWGRLLANYLQAYEHRARDVRLRIPCPKCHRRQITIDSDQGEVQVSPILVDFKDGVIRAAECGGCFFVWWRGKDLLELAASAGIELSTEILKNWQAYGLPPIEKETMTA